MLSQRITSTSTASLCNGRAPRACSTPSSRRHMMRCSSSSEGGESAPTSSGTIFYAGKSYSDAEWQEALKAGTVQADKGAPATRVAVTNSTLDNLVEVMAFSGPGPEIINGRLAMLGFVTAAAAEISSGNGIIAQWREAQTPITLTFVLFIVASLVPFLKRSTEASLGPFNAGAELLNGRAAMLGFASLLAIEAVKGSAVL